jgi:hypothetical protein
LELLAASAILGAMQLQPNPPRVITVIVALVLAGLGVVYAWPLDSLVSVLSPVSDIARSVGLTLDRTFGFLCLFASPSLLVIGSLLPGV